MRCSDYRNLAFCIQMLNDNTMLKFGFVLVVFSRVDPADERYVGSKKARGLGIP